MQNADSSLDMSACTGSTALTPTGVMEGSKTGLSLLTLAALTVVVLSVARRGSTRSSGPHSLL